MYKPKDLKEIVKSKYGQIANNTPQKHACSCGCADDSQVNDDFTLFQDEYSQLKGYLADADLGLGCGIPTQYADISYGDTVVDLGSGAGNDVFVARAIVGNRGRVIGIDMTEEMIAKANLNNKKMGYSNVDFRYGDIENIPVESNTADVVVSNCVLNLVPDKRRAFEEIFRILKPGAHFCVSDIVSRGKLPDALKSSAEMYVGCIAGAIDIEVYLEIIKQAGFERIMINHKKKVIVKPELIEKYLTHEQMQTLTADEIGLFSITVTGYKAFN